MTDAELTKKMLEALKRRYVFPEWIFLEEVPDGTGFKASRRADGFAMNLYPSKGYTKICFEIKASVSDLQRELSDGNKSNAVGKYANYFFLVCPPNVWKSESVLLPDTWGVLEYHENSDTLRQKKKPTFYEAEAVDDVFLAALLQSFKRCYDRIPPDEEIKKEREKIYQNYYQSIREAEEKAEKRVTARFESMYQNDKELLEGVKKAFGSEAMFFRDSDFQREYRFFRMFYKDAVNLGYRMDTIEDSLKNMRNALKLMTWEGFPKEL